MYVNNNLHANTKRKTNMSITYTKYVNMYINMSINMYLYFYVNKNIGVDIKQ